jgi:hypothetical protein
MLSVRIEGYHALEVLHYQARELNGLLAQIPLGISLQPPRLKPSSPKTAPHGNCRG